MREVSVTGRVAAPSRTTFPWRKFAQKILDKKIHYRAPLSTTNRERRWRKWSLFPPLPPYKGTEGESQPAVNNRQNRKLPYKHFLEEKVLVVVYVQLFTSMYHSDRYSVLLSSSSLGSLSIYISSRLRCFPSLINVHSPRPPSLFRPIEHSVITTARQAETSSENQCRRRSWHHTNVIGYRALMHTAFFKKKPFSCLVQATVATTKLQSSFFKFYVISFFGRG